ncbi:MAG: CHASE2 domain-containing protein [Phycisphaerales bacterium]|nr:MAG: CHASE2 domain-containing protein [Phycisphaerales bacterium]
MQRVQWMLGIGIALIVGALHARGLLAPAQRGFDDLHARLWRFYAPPPTDRVVIATIDDRGIETFGRWPWPRRYLAEAIREIDRAGASVIALDLLLDNPQRPEIIDVETGEVVNNDAELAAAIEAHGRVVLATSFMYSRRDESRVYGESTARLAPFPEVLRKVRADRGVSTDALRAALLPEAPPLGPATDDLRVKAERARTLLRSMDRSSTLAPPEVLKAWPISTAPQPPIAAFADVGAMLASVSFAGGDSDGVVRRIPLWTDVEGRLFPTLGLAAAAVHLGVELDDIVIDARGVLIPRGGASPLRLRTHRATLKDIADLGVRDGMLYVAWPRSGWGSPEPTLRGWRWQFARDRVVNGSLTHEPGEVSLARILETSRLIGRIRVNLRELHEGLGFADRALGGMPVDMGALNMGDEALRALEPETAEWREAFREQREAWTACVEHARWLLESFEGVEELSPEDVAFRDLCAAIVEGVPAQMAVIERGVENVVAWRAQLRSRLNGAVCFVGWTATGAAADFVSTSVDPNTPGVHVHGAVLSSILTPHLIRTGSLWLDLPALLLLGTLGVWIGVRFPVFLGPVALVAVMASYLALNHVLFWDRLGVMVASAGPFLAASLGWLSVTLHRLLVEERSRRRTEGRFRSYVSPDLVDILVNNPNLDTMAPQKRELTIMFTDLAGFTTLSERLGTEKTSAVLGAYLREMTQILQNRRATLDKYLGDGIMAFWGAPIEDEFHATHAAEAALDMLNALDRMNREGVFGDAGELVVRIGIATGDVNVGDFGNPPLKSAYTVIGDSVNLAARLESANKQLGTSAVITGRVRELLSENVRTRRLGRLKMVGKHEWVEILELLGDRRPHGDRTEEWIRLTEAGVDAFIGGDFDLCERNFGMLEKDFGDTALAGLYRRSIAALRDAGATPPDFDGSISLVEK